MIQTKDELTGIIPLCVHKKNNVSLVSEEEHVMILDGKDWPQDVWDGGTIIHVTMFVSCVCLRNCQI
jgi:hypothetical protein